MTELVYQKTKGNPFFTNQFLKSLHEDGWIEFNFEIGYWQCDITKVRELSLTDDVVEFMAARLEKLPEETQTVLKLAACIGSSFDLGTLAIVTQQSQADAFLNDLSKQARFVSDIYLIRYQPQSILCMPLLDRGQLRGILYLENQVTPGAFTSDRLELLNVIAAQAIISLQNARLYQDLENSNQTLEQKVAEPELGEGTQFCIGLPVNNHLGGHELSFDND
ncbi:hypothetical protein BI308_21880 [Roseofilum reptotaenium AO1-A]|uniref:GAF domain-containing protein n=1 Tax=Roseofilum reptotaenium AO1-A TaxID=1925591 RepID=A0A1L9QLD7_9CYAN|nr:hypothetical protein BI308_21880 [Roseofilum reptotaenium AO1-A]